MSKAPIVNVYLIKSGLKILNKIKVGSLSMLKGISGDFVLGFSGLDTVVYDIRNDTEVIRCDTQGGARPITFTD